MKVFKMIWLFLFLTQKCLWAYENVCLFISSRSLYDEVEVDRYNTYFIYQITTVSIVWLVTMLVITTIGNACLCHQNYVPGYMSACPPGKCLYTLAITVNTTIIYCIQTVLMQMEPKTVGCSFLWYTIISFFSRKLDSAALYTIQPFHRMEESEQCSIHPATLLCSSLLHISFPLLQLSDCKQNQ